MDFTYGKSFQEMVSDSNVPCRCHLCSATYPEPEKHSASCPITGFYAKWREEGVKLWERVKHIPVKIKAYDRQHFDLAV
jgi:hypothetical protein